MRSSRTWLAALLTFLALPTAAQELAFTHFTTEHQRTPLPSSSVQTVLQDRLGFLWLGFYSSGLGRWDGHELELFHRADGLPDTIVRALAEDARGYLWVATETGLAVSDQPLSATKGDARPRFRTRIGEIELPKARLRRHWLDADKDAAVWALTADEGLLRLRREGPEHLEIRNFRLREPGAPDTLPPKPVAATSLVVLRGGSVWLALEEGGLATVDAGSERLRRRQVDADEAKLGVVTAFHQGDGDTLWLGCRDGRILRLASADETLRPTLVGRLGEQISALWQVVDKASGRGELWAGSLGGGALRIDLDGKDAAETVGRRNGLLSETVWDIFQDAEGSLWLAQNAGISRLRANYRAFTHWTGAPRGDLPPLLPVSASFAVLPPSPPKGRAWAATGGGATILSPRADGALDGISIGAQDGLASQSVYGIAREDGGLDGGGRVWIGTLDGLNALVPRGAPRPPPLGDAPPPTSLELFGEAVVLLSFATDTIYDLGIFPLARNSESPAASDAEPSLWMAGTEGVHALVGGRWGALRTAAGLPNTGATSIAVGPDGRVWVGTQADGLLRSREALTVERFHELVTAGVEITLPFFEPIRTPELETSGLSLSNRRVTDLLHDGERLWVATTAGLEVLEAVDGSRRHDSPPRRLLHVLGETSTPNSVISLAHDADSGTVWAADNAGLVQISAAGRILRTVSKQDGLLDDEAWSPGSLAIGEDRRIYLATPKGISVYDPARDREVFAIPPLLLRETRITEDGREALFRYAALAFSSSRPPTYRTRLVGFDDTWSEPTTERAIRYTNLSAFLRPRRYTFEVAVHTADAAWSTPTRLAFLVQPPRWATWWAVLVYLALIAAAAGLLARRRNTALRRATERLEGAVDQRTELIRAQVQELETFDLIVQTINREVEPHAVMEALLEQGMKLVPQAAKGAFGVLDRLYDRFEIVASQGWKDDIFSDAPMRVEEARARYADGAVPMADGIFVVRRGDHGRRTDCLLSIELTLGQRAEGFLILSIRDPASLKDLDLDRLLRFRQHAISALDKSRRLAELRQRRREADEANRAKSAFLATMSHELRTPLNSILGFADILLRQLADQIDERHLRFLNNIQTSGQHLLSLINDILDLSKIEAGKMHLDLAKVAVQQIVEGVVSVAQGVATKRHIEIVQEVARDLPAMILDGPKVKQILYNLLANAVKFSADGDRVTVSTRWVEAGDSELQVASVELAVADQGIGIAPQDHARIFEEFQQASSSSTRRYPGTGLGLALVKRYAELLGGKVSVESEEGEGSIFRVLLPADATPFVTAIEREASGILMRPSWARLKPRQ